MELTNSTDFPALLLGGAMGDREMLYIIASKVTYSLENGALVPVDKDQAWPVFDKPFDYEGVTLGPELDYHKNGLDIFVFGKAMAPGGQPTGQMTVALECGKVRHETRVSGHRFWAKALMEISPTDPEPFIEMPIYNSFAYGGKTILREVEMFHPVNPDGRGYCMDKQMADGTALPNLERPDALVHSWKDQPKPACWYKPMGILDMPDFSGKEPSEVMPEMMEGLFQQTVPELVAQPEDLGDCFRLVGFSSDGDIIFPCPHLQGPTAHVSIDDSRSRFPSKISSIVILAEQKIMIVTYLCVFRYLFRAEDKRSVELKWSGNAKVDPVKK